MLIPPGKTVAECMETALAMQLSRVPFVSVIACHGELQSLNLTATLIIEGLYAKRTVQEIANYLTNRFTVNCEETDKILQDIHDFILYLEQKNWIVPENS